MGHVRGPATACYARLADWISKVGSAGRWRRNRRPHWAIGVSNQRNEAYAAVTVSAHAAAKNSRRGQIGRSFALVASAKFISQMARGWKRYPP